VPYVVAEPCVDVKDKHALTSAMNVYSRRTVSFAHRPTLTNWSWPERLMGVSVDDTATAGSNHRILSPPTVMAAPTLDWG
jgi:hypothetical protein